MKNEKAINVAFYTQTLPHQRNSTILPKPQELGQKGQK
jgi:hypothetical protein